MGKRQLTQGEIVSEIYSLVGDEYSVIGEYSVSNTPVEIKHNKCGHVYKVRISNFRHGRRCPKCSKRIVAKSRRKTQADFVAEVYSLVGDEYSVVSDYINCKTKVTMTHNICGNKYEVIPNSLLRGRRCPHCYKSKKKTQEEFINDVTSILGDEYTVLSNYINAKTKVRMKHSCGCEYEIAPDKIISRGDKCPNCFNNHLSKVKNTSQKFYKKFDEVSSGEYELLSEYRGIGKYIKLKHIGCGSVYDVRAGNFIYLDRRCPSCSPVSKGESRIREYLEQSEIPFEAQFIFDDLRNKQPLRFDFAVFNKDKTHPELLIEFDGEQHFKPIEFFGGVPGYENTKFRDNLKNDYCKEKGIKLVRIPYWEYENIEHILEREVS